MAGTDPGETLAANAVTLMTTGHRYGASEAKAAALVDDTATARGITDAGVTRLTAMAGKDPGTLGAIKNTMYGNILKALVATNH